MKAKTIIQIGACKGNDEVTDFVRENEIGLLVLVEPLGGLRNEELLKCYEDTPNVVIYNVAITPKPTTEKQKFYIHPDGPGAASLDIKHVARHFPDSIDKIVSVDVPCMTMYQLFDLHQITDVDLLAIDAEGYDAEIIGSIDLKKFNIKRIVFEYINLASCSYLGEFREFLMKQGYTLNFYSHYDIEAVKQ